MIYRFCGKPTLSSVETRNKAATSKNSKEIKMINFITGRLPKSGMTESYDNKVFHAKFY